MHCNPIKELGLGVGNLVSLIKTKLFAMWKHNDNQSDSTKFSELKLVGSSLCLGHVKFRVYKKAATAPSPNPITPVETPK